MPGIDTDAAVGAASFPERLERLLMNATGALERQAAEGRLTPEGVARAVGVFARSGVSLETLGERRDRRRRAAAAEMDETEQATMDDAEDAPFDIDGCDPAELERGLRTLSRNLRLGTPDGGAHARPAVGDADRALAELGEARRSASMAA